MRRATGALGLIGIAAGAWEAQRRVDRRRLLSDPEREALEAPLEGRATTVTSADGTDLHVEVFGPEDAPTIVLVHGWTCALRFWIRQIQALSSDFRVLTYDLRGHGRSGAPATPDYSTDAFASDFDAVLEACVPKGERPLVAGHSLGAMLLVAWAGAHAEEVDSRLRGVALVNTGIGDLVTESLVVWTPRRLDRVRRATGRALLSASVPFPKGSTPISARAVRYVALSPSATPAQVAFCERMVLECRRDVRAAYGSTLSRLELTELAETLRVPAAVIAGERDRLTPPVHAQRLAEALPEVASYVELPGVGHMAPVEAPDAVTATIARLAARQATAADRLEAA